MFGTIAPGNEWRLYLHCDGFKSTSWKATSVEVSRQQPAQGASAQQTTASKFSDDVVLGGVVVHVSTLDRHRSLGDMPVSSPGFLGFLGAWIWILRRVYIAHAGATVEHRTQRSVGS